MTCTRRAAIGGLAASLLPLRAADGAPGPAGNAPLVLEAKPGELRLRPAPAAATAVWTYNGSVPGPLIRIRLGEEITVRLVNRLAQPTSLCWHGMRIANAADGVAGLTQAPVHPGNSLDVRFLPPDAGVYWYHPHVFPNTAEQTSRGLYGAVIVDEHDPPQVDQDLLVVIDDWTLDATGQLAGTLSPPGDARRDTIVTVNSVPAPCPPVAVRPGARLRLRLLNVCASRIALLAFAGAAPLIVAIDGQPSELFPPAGNMIPIGPGSSFEVMLDMPRDAAPPPALLLRDAGGDRPLLTFALHGSPVGVHAAVARLAPNPLLPTRIALERSLQVKLALANAGGAAPSAWTINGVAGDGSSGKPLFRAKLGRPVTLTFVNQSAVAQQMHVHGHAFRVLHDLDDGWDPYWRTSILLAPGKTKHVAFVADNPGRWAIESAMLEPQVSGLAGWFEVGG